MNATKVWVGPESDDRLVLMVRFVHLELVEDFAITKHKPRPGQDNRPSVNPDKRYGNSNRITGKRADEIVQAAKRFIYKSNDPKLVQLWTKHFTDMESIPFTKLRPHVAAGRNGH
jgi:hypothetical protein